MLQLLYLEALNPWDAALWGLSCSVLCDSVAGPELISGMLSNTQTLLERTFISLGLHKHPETEQDSSADLLKSQIVSFILSLRR